MSSTMDRMIIPSGMKAAHHQLVKKAKTDTGIIRTTTPARIVASNGLRSSIPFLLFQSCAAPGTCFTGRAPARHGDGFLPQRQSASSVLDSNTKVACRHLKERA